MQVSRIAAPMAIALSLGAATTVFAAADEKAQADRVDPAAAKEAKGDAGPKGVKAAGPRLEMGKDHPKNPGKERDMRHCLDLPDTKDVIRCYEKK